MIKIIFTIFIFCFLWSENSNKEKSYLEYIDVITTNDIHGFIAEQYADFISPQYPPKLVGGSAFKKYIREYQADLNNDLLIFDGGNFFQGNPLGVSDSGKSIIEWMNMIEYDALVPGPSDFIYGAKNLNQLADIANFPFLASNINCNECDLFSSNIQPYIIKEISGIKVGIIGIVDSDLDSKVLQKNIHGILVDSEYDAINKWSSILKDSTDVLIILTSSGIPWDREIVYNNFLNSLNNGLDPSTTSLNAIEMGYFCHDIDLIISGGISKGYDIPWHDKSSGVYAIQNYGNGTSFGHLKLVVHKPSNYFTGYELIINNKLTQTLMQDDFSIDYNMNSWIEDKHKKAVKLNNDTLFDYLNSSEKKIDYDIQIEMENNFNLIKDNWNFPAFGSNYTTDIMTWNCEFFPAADIETIEALAEAINDMDIDIIAFQEIKYRGWFDDLMNLIPMYDYAISNQSSFMDQALIFKKDSFKFIRQVEPFSDRDYNFAGRPPLRVDLQSKINEEYISIINLHMKCCNSGLQRRKKASEMLHQYLSKEMNEGYENFIVLGDWNDDLKDHSDEHCFNPFLNDDRFFFVTERIIYDTYQATYPKEPYISFLDHILVTKKLIPGLKDYQRYDVMTVRVDHYMDSFLEYERLISDHFPVLLSFSW